MSLRISKNSLGEETASGENTMSAGRAVSPPEFNLKASEQSPGMDTFANPIQAKSEQSLEEEPGQMVAATQILKFLDHLDVILDLKDSLTPSLLSTIKTALRIRKMVNAASAAKKGMSPGKGLGFAFSAIDMTYWASVKAAKLLARGVWAGQELAGQISAEQYEDSVDNLEDSVPDSLLGLALMPSETYQSLIKIKRLSKNIMDEFSGLANLKKSLQNGDASMLDVFKTVSNLKDSIEDLVELCKEVQELVEDLGFELDLEPIEKAVHKFSSPLRSMKEVMGEDKAKAKSETEESNDGGWSSLKKSLEPGYKPLLDSLLP